MAESKFGTFKVDLDVEPFREAFVKIKRGAEGLGLAFEAADNIAAEVERYAASGLSFDGATVSDLTEARAENIKMARDMIAYVVLIDEAIAAKAATTTTEETPS